MATKLKIVIVGGVAGGASAATRIRRLSENAEIILIERSPYISFANCGLPYYLAGVITHRDNLLLQSPNKMRERYNLDVRVNSEVTAIDRTNRQVSITNLNTNEKYCENYDALILSPGAKPIIPSIPGSTSPGIFTLRNIPDMDAIDSWIKNRSAKTAVIVGGGYIGLEMAEALQHRNLQVTMVELAPQVMGPVDNEMANLLHQELLSQGVKLELASAAREFIPNATNISIKLSTNKNLTADIVILAMGVKPEVTLAKNAGLTIGELGGIVVDQSLKTSDPSIYAIGDAIEVNDFVSKNKILLPLAGPANRQARIVADNILGRATIYHDTQGTGVCKVFGLTVGMTGLNEKYLQHHNYPYEKIYLHANDHAGYYPGATLVHLKVLFNPHDGTIFGAQAIGAKGIENRIDVIATAMRAQQKITELQHAELSYAPPYGSAKDIVNFAGFVADNILRNDVKICHVAAVIKIASNQLLLDVRTAAEVACGTIPGAINIPIDELRGRITELPIDKEIIVFCKVGIRGYLAYRILTQHGFNCRNLSGGYQTYLMATNSLPFSPLGHCQNKINSPETSEENAMISNSNNIIDARGLQCPGPIQKLKIELDKLASNAVVTVLASDRGFLTDAAAWCNATGNTLLKIDLEADYYRALIKKGTAPITSSPLQAPTTKNLTIVVFSGDLDKALAAFIIANGAAAMGYKPILFFTFWGINILRKANAPKTQKSFIERMFSWLMPKGAKQLALSKMHLCGMGSAMIKYVMQRKNVSSLPELIQSAITAKVRLIACSMSMDLIGIKREELLDNVEVGGVAAYLEQAGASGINLFI